MSVVYTARGMPVSTFSPPLAHALHAFEEQVLDYGSQAGALLDALRLDPECALAASYAAALHLFRATREGHERSKPLADAAVLMNARTARERSLVAAIARWAAGDVPAAVQILVDWSGRAPRDLFAARLLQHLLFSTGAAGAMLAAIEPVAAAIPKDRRALGMLAFALDQTGHHIEGERAARAALEIGPDPWAHHALAHVMDAEGRHREGRSWMRDHAGAWANCTSFLYTHNWWHAALFHLALGDRDGALALYHERVWAVRKDYVQDQVNAVSLLARLELAGVDVGDRWQDVAHYVRPRRSDAIDGFLDLHYALALARAGDMGSVDDLLAALSGAAGDGSLTRRVTLMVAQGLVAFAGGDRPAAASLLGAAAPHLALLGGSTVQRRLFTDLLAAARTGAHPPLVRAA